MLSRTAASLLSIGALATGCATLPPALTNAVVAFGQELIGSASANYAPDYAQSVNQLLLAVAEVASGAPFTQMPVSGPYGGYGSTPYGGYSTPSYDAAGNPVYGDYQTQYPSAAASYPGAVQYPGTTQYPGTPQYPETTQYPSAPQYPDTSQYPSAPQYPDTTQYPGAPQYPETTQYPSTPQYPDTTQYPGTPQYPSTPPYPDTSQYPNTTQYPGASQYPNANQYPNTNQYPSTAPYPEANQYPGSASGTYPVAPTLDAALLAQTVTGPGQTSLRPVQDGEILYDGGDDPAAGDKIKLSFQANCACFLYVIGIDATGWVTQMYPEAQQASAPLVANQTYLLPAGTEWWGLDAYKGVEHIYFVLSRVQRLDLEQTLRTLPVNRPSPGANYQAVSQPALLATRGMVKVQAAAPTTVATSYGRTQSVALDSFSSQLQSGDLVVTRWFQHQ